MRFLVAIVVSALLLGSVALCQYLTMRDIDVSLSRDVDEHGGQGDEHDRHEPYRLHITVGFEAVKDPFALTIDDDTATARLAVRSAGRVLLTHNEDLRRGQTISVPDVPFAGTSAAVLVSATPSREDATSPCALRLRIYRGDVLCDEGTLWSPGNRQPVQGELDMSLEPQLAELDRGLGRDEE